MGVSQREINPHPELIIRVERIGRVRYAHNDNTSVTPTGSGLPLPSPHYQQPDTVGKAPRHRSA